MMGRFRFFLNDQPCPEPLNWMDFTETIKRDNEVHGFVFTYDDELQFGGEGYKVINDIFRTEFCAELEFRAEQRCGSDWELVALMLIKIPDMDTNLNRCICSIKGTDSTYFGMIHNNRDLIVPMDSEFSKNGIPITPCPEVDFKVFNPTLNGDDHVVYRPELRTAYDQRDVLEYVLRYITDNRITTVQSAYFDNFTWIPSEGFGVDPDDVGDVSFLFLPGIELRRHGEQPVSLTIQNINITFAGLMDTLHKKHGLFWRIQGSTMIIEPYASNFDTPSIDIVSQREIERTVMTELLYAKVSVGSATNIKDRELAFALPYVDLIAHADQEYPLGGVCNTDNILDLVNDYVIDSNIIEKTIAYGDVLEPTDTEQEYDDQVFYVQYFKTATGNFACFSTYFIRPQPSDNPTGVVYNPDLFNSVVLTKHQLPSGFSLQTLVNDDNFRASMTEYRNVLTDENDFLPTTSVGLTPQQQGGLLALFGISGWSFQNVIDQAQEFLTFNDDFTPPNFDPNDNYDLDDFSYIAPVSGVYQFEISLIVNKAEDSVLVGGSYQPINTLPANSRALYPSRFNVSVWGRIYDPLGTTPLTEVLAQNQSGRTFTQFEVRDGSRMGDSIGVQFPTPAGVIPTIIEAGDGITAPVTSPAWSPVQYQILTSNFANCVNIPQNWQSIKRVGEQGNATQNNAFVNTMVTVYMAEGQRFKVGANVRTRTHPFVISAPLIQRKIRYGVFPNSSVRTSFILGGGGDFGDVDPKLMRILNYTFSRPLTLEIWRQMKNSPSAGFRISPTIENKIISHINNVKRNLATGATEFELIGNRDQTYF